MAPLRDYARILLHNALRQRKGYDRERARELLLLSVKLAVEARDRFWVEHQGLSASTTVATASAASQTRTPLPLSPSTTSKTTAATPPMVQAQQQCGRPDEKRHGRRRPLVAASIGCYGAALADGSEYRGGYGDTVGQRGLQDWHKERLDILARADGVDLVMFETIPCLAEVRAILALLEVSEIFVGVALLGALALSLFSMRVSLAFLVRLACFLKLERNYFLIEVEVLFAFLAVARRHDPIRTVYMYSARGEHHNRSGGKIK